MPNGTVAGGATAVTNTPQLETHPRLAADLLVWQRQNSGSGYDLYARPLDANGLPTGETFVIQEAAGNQQGTAVAYSTNGRYQLAWQDDSTGPWDLFTAVLDRSYQVTHIQYEYDPLGRMTSADYHGDFNGEYSYAYDAVGNRTAYTTTITSTMVITYHYDAANRLLESVELNGDTTTYQWDDAGRLIKEAIVGSNITRLYTYNQRGNLTSALVNGLLTTFVYDGNGHRLQMSVGSEITTYTLDYAAGFRVLFEQGGASSITKHYLYGLACIGEQVDVGDAQNSEWRYYHQDGNHLVRQTTNMEAAVTLAWTYSPEGAIVIGEEGPVTHLGCDGNTTYDFSTGLIFKNGHYFDPNTGIWLTMSGMMVWNGWQSRPGNGRQRKRSKEWILLLLLFLIVLVLTGCAPTPSPTPTATPCPTPSIPGLPSNTPGVPSTPTLSPTPTPMPPTVPPSSPTGSVIIYFGGSNGNDLNEAMDEVDTQMQAPVWVEKADVVYDYPGGSKQNHADMAFAQINDYKNKNLLLIGYSAGADSALLFADKYYQYQRANNYSGRITGIALLGGTMTNQGEVINNWQNILDNLLLWGTDVYVLNDAANGGDEVSTTGYKGNLPPGAVGTFKYDDRPTQQHWNDYHISTSYGYQQGWPPEGTNNDPDYRDFVLNWFATN